MIRAKKHALQEIRGVDGPQFERLWDYCAIVIEKNPSNNFVEES